jgi:hypothetical protein
MKWPATIKRTQQTTLDEYSSTVMTGTTGGVAALRQIFA